MNALRFEKTVDDATVAALPELKPFAGRRVEVIVLEAESAHEPRQTFDEFLAKRPPWPASRPSVSLEEMDAAIASGAAGDHA
jgi:hypothetical protein